MRCHSCGGDLRPTITDLPFKVTPGTLVILKALPVLQCENCQEYQIEDNVMERVEALLAKASLDAELEVVRFAA